MLILDTDHLSILDQNTTAAFELGRRLANQTSGSVAVTIITYEEQMRGWLAYAARAGTAAHQISAYRKLRKHVERFREIPIIDFDAAAAAQLERLQQSRIRIGTMDLKIAAICLAQEAMLLTRNLVDFGKVPGLRAEDWSV